MNKQNNPRCFNTEELEKIELGNNITAGWYLHGICGVFALTLHKKFGYEIEVVTESPSTGNWQTSLVHIYCKSKDRYIDVRGMFSDRNLFLEEFEDFFDIPGFISITAEDLTKFLLYCMNHEELQTFSRKAEELIKMQEVYAVHI